MFAELELIKVGQRAYRSKKMKSGVCCTFSLLNRDYGVKLYDTREVRDMCCNRQDYAAQHGLAPQVIQTFEFTRIKAVQKYDYEKQKFVKEAYHIKVYGFVTEVVVLHGDCEQKINGWNECPSTYDNLEALREALREIGMNPGDLHADNYGWNESGIVATDFSHFD